MVGWLPSWSGGRLMVVGKMLCKQWNWICYPFVCVRSEGGAHWARNGDAEVERRVWELMLLLLEERSRPHGLLTEIGVLIISAG